jgi:tetratricopeptide (TPR) repeat protein
MSDAVTSAEAVESLESDLAAAEQMLAGGDLGQALRMWAAIRERFPGHAAAYLRAAHALADGGDFDKAEILLLEGQLLVQSAGPTFASEFARMAARQRDAAEAVRRWSVARMAFPRHPVGWVGGVESLREAGRVNEAEVLLDQLRERFPAEAAIPILAASLADAAKDWSKSVDLWAVAREHLPQNPIGFIKGAKALSQNGDLDQADALLADGIDRFPGNAELVTQWAELAVYRQRWSDAVERWALLRQQHPTIPLGYVNGSTALLAAGRAAEAEALITAAIEQFPDRPDVRRQQARYADMQCGLARTMAAQDRQDEAEALLRSAMQRFPDRHDLFAEYAAVATRRHDWTEALRRWRDAHRRFPEIKEFRHRTFEAELRVVETTASAAELSAQPPTEQVDPAVEVSVMRAVVTRFESLGGTLHGCEFGLFQRDCGAEPLGLLRWTEMGPDNLIAALEGGFEGVGLPENTELGVHPTPDGPEYFTRDKRFMMSMHTFIKESDISYDKMFEQSCRRLRFLRDKLIDDLRSEEKIFVYKITWRVLTPQELARIHLALRRYGNPTLLYVRREIPGRPHGTVDVVKPGLMVGYIDRFSASPTGESLGPATKSWSLLCQKALAAFKGGEAGSVVAD